ncbi:sporulation protein YjcZ [Evansella sp. AB-P1]|nr:sporulation protein YjcZ [Evansella sp. AB-P1]MDG5787118.1 sporulation protein YjcZ [Evansella sp. AB-P1]
MTHTHLPLGGFSFILVIFILLVIIGSLATPTGYGYF